MKRSRITNGIHLLIGHAQKPEHQMLTKTPLSQLFEDALVFAHRAHQLQFRKASTIPYMSHLLAVCSIVLDHGGNEHQAIAALLHDAPEDQGGLPMLNKIKDQFGKGIALLVSQCSEPLEIANKPWTERKSLFLDHLRELPSDAILIIAADKTHNLSSILDQHLIFGDDVFQRFGGKKKGTVWYYSELATVLVPRIPIGLGNHLKSLADDLNKLAKR